MREGDASGHVARGTHAGHKGFAHGGLFRVRQVGGVIAGRAS